MRTPLNGGCADEKPRFTEKQIAFALKPAELGTPVLDVCRKLGISAATFYSRRKKYGGISPSELKHMRQIEEEYLRLKRLVTDLILDIAMLQDVLATLALLRERVRDLQARYGANERQVCFALQVSRSSFCYRFVAADDSALWLRIRDITETRGNYGYRWVSVMLRREGWRDNHKRIYRLYSEQGCRCALNDHGAINLHSGDNLSLRVCIRITSGGMGFVSDVLFYGRRLHSIALSRPLSQLLKTDNSSGFTGRMLDKWVYEREIRINFSRPGTPADKATVESFNSRLRQECLNS